MFQLIWDVHAGTEKVLGYITSELQETTDVVEPGMIAAMLDIGCVDIDGKILLREVISESWEYRDGVKPGVTSVILVSGFPRYLSWLQLNYPEDNCRDLMEHFEGLTPLDPINISTAFDSCLFHCSDSASPSTESICSLSASSKS